MSYFLWPSPHLSWRLPNVGMQDVERRCAELYPDTFPVLFSSARAALSATVEALDLTRRELLWTPPFSSHCVLEAISRLTTPLTVWEPAQFKTALVYHQWGFVHHSPAGLEVLEDSADSLCVPGAIDFPNQGRFQIFSLPKILGCATGGLVLCRLAQDAEGLRKIRDGRSGSVSVQLALRLAGHHSSTAHQYWQGAEALNGGLPSMACADILGALEQLPRLISDRKAKFELATPVMAPWAKIISGRWPAAIPVECSEAAEGKLRTLGLTAGFRHFNSTQRIDQETWKKVVPLPIHQGIPMDVLARCVDVLRGDR